MRMNNIEDLPFDPSIQLNSTMMDKIIEYCDHDVNATELFYTKCKDAISLRNIISKEYNHNVMNYSDVKIGEYINQVTYSKLSGKNFKTFKYLQTERDMIPISELIPDFVEFKTDNFKSFLEEIKKESINANTKDDWYKYLKIDNMSIKFAKGGLHSEDKPGITLCKKDHFLKEKDVGSMYPKAIIAGNYYPKHLGPTWNEGINLLYTERTDVFKPKLKELEKGSIEYTEVNSKQNVYKLAMNGGGYGKTGSDYGWQKDKLVMFKVTFRGQLSLLMLLEEYYLLGNIELISANTDGIVIHYPKHLDDKVQKIHDEWEIMTDSILEDTFYKKIINRDVNNYIAEIIDENNNTLYFKYKGCFEIDRDFHKNHSKRIVPIALANYYINGVKPIETIYNHFLEDDYSFCKNYGVFDFCLGSKMKGKNKLFARTTNSNSVNDLQLGRVTRYYVSNDGVELIKKLPPSESNYLTETDKHPENQMNMFDIIEDVKVDPKDRETSIEAGWKSTVFNKYIDDDYDLNYSYYINEVNKIINKIN